MTPPFTRGGNLRAATVVVLSGTGGLPLDDETLIRRAQDGDADAFEEMVRRYQDAAFRAAYLILRDAADAEDAAQEGLLRAYRAIGRFQAGRQFRPWLLRIVVNQALNLHKARRRRAAMTERLARDESLKEGAMDWALIDRERANRLWAALQALPEQERTIIYLRYFLDLSERELAEYLRCAPGTVKSRLHRALRRLRDLLSHRYPELLSEAT